MPVSTLTARAVPALALVAALGLAGPARAQDSTAAPNVGQLAPDFTAPGATRFGLLQSPVKLSDFRGKTVVLAFFFKARTKGWTIQMEAYRDQYAKLFNGGKNVVVIGMSVDPDTALASWAKDESFPILFASDSDGQIGRAYGIWNPKYKLDTRVVFVIDPEGKISYRAMPFRELTQDAYTQLAAAVDRTVTRGEKAGAGK